MTIPTTQLVWAGVWNVATTYPQYQFVQSPVDGLCYVNVNVQPIVGGDDPSVQPSLFWVLLNVPSGGGITDINGLTDTVINITSSDNTVTITPTAPSTIDLSVSPFPPVYGGFSSSVTQNLTASSALDVEFNTADCTISDISIVGTGFPSTQFKLPQDGTYKILASIQIDKTSGGTGAIYMYPMVNGVAAPNSATKLVVNQNAEDIMTIEWFLTLSADDLIGIQCYSPDSGIRLLAIPASTPVPATPSIILTILRIGVV